MKKYDLYVGCNVNGKPEYRVDYVQHVFEQLFEVLGFDGATFTEAVGLWKGVEERTVICTICTDKPYKEIFNLASWIKQHLKQESVMVIESEPRIEFV